MDFNVLSVTLEEILASNYRIMGGIRFSGVCFVKLFVDGRDLAETPAFEDSLVVYSQLRESFLRDGHYLLFTSMNGVADDAGWDMVNVNHDGDVVVWNISRDDHLIRFVFNRTDGMKAIEALAQQIRSAELRGLKLEPTHVLYPEAWVPISRS